MNHASTSCCQREIATVRDERHDVERKLADQGDHECEVLGPGAVVKEADQAWRECDKNLGHKTFIPVAQFHKDLLPEGFKTDLHLNYIKYISKRTVRLRVLYTSEERPKAKGYAFAEYGGFWIPHTGSGWINDVSYMQRPCVCSECEGKSHPVFGYYQIRVHTALHVVYNTEEALETKVDLYLEEGSTDEGRKPTMLTLCGKQATDINPKRDLCTVLCATHDKQLFTELRTFIAEKEAMSKCLRENAVGNAMLARSDSTSVADACIIVSHPHGKPKRITVGRLAKEKGNAGISNKFDSYETDTCRGSSGAPVIIWRAGEVNPDPYAIPAPHSEGRKGGLNSSGGRPFFFG